MSAPAVYFTSARAVARTSGAGVTRRTRNPHTRSRLRTLHVAAPVAAPPDRIGELLLRDTPDVADRLVDRWIGGAARYAAA